jgi:hypothetical protein
LEAVLSRCRTLYNVALEQRKTWWGRGQGIGATCYQQARELPDLKAACPEFGEVHSQVLQDVLRRVGKTYAAFVRRRANAETPDSLCASRGEPLSLVYLSAGWQRCGAGRWATEPVQAWPYSHPHAPTLARHPQDGHHQPESGRLVRLHHLCGRCRCSPSHRPGARRASMWGCAWSSAPLKVVPSTIHGTCVRRTSCWGRRIATSRGARAAAIAGQRQWPGCGAQTSRSSASVATCTTRRRWTCCTPTTPSRSTMCGSPIWCAPFPRQEQHRCGVAAVAHHPRRPSSVRWPASACGPRPVDQPGL